MNTFAKAAATFVAAAFIAPVAALADDVPSVGFARVSLDGFQEAPQAIFTTGEGDVRLRRRRDVIEYELSYSDLVGDITQSVGVHIHFGRPAVTGGIAAFLCEGPGLAAPVGTPICVDDGTGSGVVTGEIRADDVLAIAGQGFPAGDLDAFWEIIITGSAYVNLHTDQFPSGEIRGDIPARGRGRR